MNLLRGLYHCIRKIRLYMAPHRYLYPLYGFRPTQQQLQPFVSGTFTVIANFLIKDIVGLNRKLESLQIRQIAFLAHLIQNKKAPTNLGTNFSGILFIGRENLWVLLPWRAIKSCLYNCGDFPKKRNNSTNFKFVKIKMAPVT